MHATRAGSPRSVLGSGHGGLHRSSRPGHDEHPVHGVRPRRPRGGAAPARARAGPPPRRVGRARPARDLGPDPDGDGHGPDPCRPRRVRPRRDRGDQPARDRDRLGPAHRPAAAQRDRLAGHAHRRDRPGARGRRAWRGHPGAGRPAAGDVLLGRQGPVDARERRRPARGRRAWRRTLRHPRHVGGLEPHRRTGRGRPRHRRHQRQPDDAHGPDHPGLGRGAARLLRHPARDAAHHPSEQRRRGLREHLRGAADRADRHRRRPRRPAGGHGGPGVLRARGGEEHLRDRQLPPAQHRRGARPQRERAAHHRRVPVRRRPAGLRARGVDRRHRQRRPVAARPARHHQRRLRGRAARRPGRGLRRHLLRPRLQRPVRPVLAQRRPRGRSSVSHGSTPTPTWPGPPSRRSATSPATSPTRWSPTRGSS